MGNQIKTLTLAIGFSFLYFLSPSFILSSEKSSDKEDKAFKKISFTVRKKLTSLAITIDKKTKGAAIGYAVLSSDQDEDLGETKKAVTDLLLQSFVSRSLLIAPLKYDEEVVLKDDEDKTTKKIVLQKKNITHLTKKNKLEIVMLVTVLAKGKKISLSLELLHIKKGRRLGTYPVSLVKEADAESLQKMNFFSMWNVKVLTFAAANIGKKVDKGECWDLPARILNDSGFAVHSYDFGTKVPWEEALPGDVLTIDNGKFRHVMVLHKPEEVMKNSKILHQNVNKKRYVIKDKVFAKYPPEDVVVWRPGVRK